MRKRLRAHFHNFDHNFAVLASARPFYELFAHQVDTLPWMMKNKYEEHVFAPKSVDELHDICQQYEYAGSLGAAAVSMVCTYLGMDLKHALSMSAKRNTRRLFSA